MKKRRFAVSQFAEVLSGGTPSTAKRQYWDGDIPWITPKDLSAHTDLLIFHGERSISEEGLIGSSATLLPTDTVVLSSRAPIGYVAIAGQPLATNQGCKNLVCNEELARPSFIYYLLKCSTRYLEASASGATFKELSASRLKSLCFDLPDVIEQDQIVNILLSYDNLIECNRRRIQLLEEAARQLYREWFVRLRFPGHEHVKIKDGVPDGWRRKPLGEIATLNYGKALQKDSRVAGEYPVFGSSGIIGTHESAWAKGPAVIVGRKGNVGSVFWSEMDFNPIDTVYYITADKSSLYLYHALQHTKFMSTDVAVPGLNRDLAHSKDLLDPDRKVKAAFEEDILPLHNQMHCLTKYNAALTQARDLLLPRLMNGDIAV